MNTETEMQGEGFMVTGNVTVPFCTDCLFFKKDASSVDAYANCGHPNSKRTSLITGGSWEQTCGACRTRDSLCGQSAQWFKPK